MKKLLLTLTAIACLTLNANATWYVYDGGNGAGWVTYGWVPDGSSPDATQYYSNISACAAAFQAAMRRKNLP